MRALVDKHGGRMPQTSNAPKSWDWTEEADLLADVVGELRGLKAILIKINSKPGTPVQDPPVILRPVTALQKVLADARLARHRKLADRLVRKDSSEETTE